MAITQGASSQNVKLLAKVIVGLVGSQKPIYTDEFIHSPSMLEKVSYEELLTLAKIWNTFYSLEYAPEEQGGFDDVEQRHQKMLADVLAIIMYHKSDDTF